MVEEGSRIMPRQLMERSLLVPCFKNFDVPALPLQLKKMKEKKGLYPDKSIYTQQIGPGLCFGALALMLRFFFEEWDYTYVHSFYHCALAMSFVLLLPKVNKKAGNAGPPAKMTFSTLCCACV